MRQQLESALTIVGAVVGAGFASGREIYQFFVRHGAKGLLGVFLAVFLLCVLCLRVLSLSKKYGVQTLQELIRQHLGQSASQILSAILGLVLWLGLGVMLSGAGAAGESLGVNKAITMIVTSVIIVLCLYSGISGIKKANAVFIPLLIAVSVYLFYRGMQHSNYSFLIIYEPIGSMGWIWSAVLYASLNSLLVFVITPPLSAEGSALGLILGCIICGFLLLCITLLLLSFPVLSAESPVPMLSIAADIAPRMPQVYGVLLWTALTTTALANGLGLKSYAQTQLRIQGGLSSLVAVVVSLPIAFISFDQLVAVVYTGLGYIALVLVIAIFMPSR